MGRLLFAAHTAIAHWAANWHIRVFAAHTAIAHWATNWHIRVFVAQNRDRPLGPLGDKIGAPEYNTQLKFSRFGHDYNLQIQGSGL